MSIRVDTYRNAATRAKQLSARNIHLTTTESSVLGQLLDSSVSYQGQPTSTVPSVLQGNVKGTPVLVKNVDYFAQDVESNTRDGEEPSVHTLRIQALSEDLAPSITNHIAVARNEVAPLVSQYVAKLENYIAETKPQDPSGKFTIVKARIPKICLDEAFVSDLEVYDGKKINPVEERLEITAEQEEGFYKRLKDLGNDRLNDLLEDWLEDQPKDYLKTIFTNVFTNNDLNGDENAMHPLYARGVNADMNFALGLYIVSCRLFAEPQSVPGMSLEKYKETVLLFKDYAGCLLLKSLRTMVRQNETKVLVAEANPSLKRITVHEDVYKEFLEEGGSPEVLLGMLVSGNVVYAKSVVNEEKENLIRQWKNYVMLSKADNKAEFLTRLKDYAEAEAILGLNDLSEMEKEYAATLPDYRSIVEKKIKEEIESHVHCLTDDIYHFGLHVIAKARYFYTSAYRILSCMEELNKAAGDVDPREAALLSVIDYVAEYMVAQIRTTQ